MAEQAKGFKSLKELAKDKALKRNAIWVGAAALIAATAGYIILTSGSRNAPPAELTGVRLNPMPQLQADASMDDGGRSAQIAQQREQARAEKAVEGPESSFHDANSISFADNDPGAYTRTDTPKLSDGSKVEEGKGQTTPPPPPPPPVQQPANPEALKEYYAAIADAIKGLDQRRQPRAPTEVNFTHMAHVQAMHAAQLQAELDTHTAALQPEEAAESPRATSADAQVPQQGRNTQKAEPIVLMGKGDVVTAINMLHVDTDVPGPVTAQIASGPLTGGLLLGTVARQEERALLTFTSLRLPPEYGNHSINISAVSLGVDDLKLGNATDVDRHYILRYGVRPLMTALTAAANALIAHRNSYSTTVLPNGTTITQQNNRMRGRDYAAVGVGSAAEQLAADINQQSINPTVTVAPNEMIGVLFLSDVTVDPSRMNPPVATDIHPALLAN